MHTERSVVTFYGVRVHPPEGIDQYDLEDSFRQNAPHSPCHLRVLNAGAEGADKTYLVVDETFRMLTPGDVDTHDAATVAREAWTWDTHLLHVARLAGMKIASNVGWHFTVDETVFPGNPGPADSRELLAALHRQNRPPKLGTTAEIREQVEELLASELHRRGMTTHEANVEATAVLGRFERRIREEYYEAP